MRHTRLLAAVLSALVLSSAARAQTPPAVPGAPPLPGGPTPTATAGTAAAAGAPAAAPKNLWSFFMKTPEQKAQCKAHFCNSRIGQFFNNMMLPAGMATGGLLGPVCPPPGTANPADLAKPATSAQGAAAKIQAEEAQAKAKIAAIEYLATVDCRYYPEAEAALINGLRAEKNECVRLAAAKAFASGCCCSAKVIKALTISVNCSTADKFPAEASELVRTYAYVALERCLRKCIEAEPEVPPEPPPAAKKAMYETLAPMGTVPDYHATILLSSYYSPDSKETHAAIFAAARQSLGRGLQVSQQTVMRLAGPRNVRDLMFPDGVKPVSLALPQLTRKPEVEDPGRHATAAGGPVEPGQPMAVTRTVPERQSGRGNLLHIVQDSWRR